MFTSKNISDIHFFEVENNFLAFNIKTNQIKKLDKKTFNLFQKLKSGEIVSMEKDGICKELQDSLLMEDQNELPFLGNPEILLDLPLRSLSLLITPQCNMRCDYCFNHQGAYEFERKQPMSLGTAKNAINFLLSNCENQCGVSFFGGEPLLQFKLIEQIVLYGEREAEKNEIEMFFNVTTNGTLITKEIAQFLTKHRFSVIISLDGDEKTHNYHRKFKNGKGSYRASLKGAELLRSQYSSQDKITIRGTYSHQQTSFSYSFSHLLNLGFENISIEPAIGNELDSYAIQPDDIEALRKEYSKLTTIYKKTQNQSPQVKFFHFEKHINDLLGKRKANRPCGAANGYMTVAPDGGLYPCHRIVSQFFYLGNVNEVVCTKSSLNKEIQQIFLKATTSNRPSCQTCWARYMCGGSCYADNLEKDKNILKSDPIYCMLFKLRIELIINLIAERAISTTNINSEFNKHEFSFSKSCPSRCECQCQFQDD